MNGNGTMPESNKSVRNGDSVPARAESMIRPNSDSKEGVGLGKSGKGDGNWDEARLKFKNW
jgi:hypothetical protein